MSNDATIRQLENHIASLVEDAAIYQEEIDSLEERLGDYENLVRKAFDHTYRGKPVDKTPAWVELCIHLGIDA